MREDRIAQDGGPRLKVVYIEDRDQDAENYTPILTARGKMKIDRFPPSSHPDVETIIRKAPDLVLIDYELSRKRSNGKMASYQGGTLATRLREQLRDYPIVLFTRRKILSEYSPQEELGAVDYILYKEDLERAPHENIQRLIGIVNGFSSLRGISPKTWNSLLKILQVTSSEIDILREAGAPIRIQEATRRARTSGQRGAGGVWSVRGVAKWIMETLFAYPGILYDSLYASASIGIEEKSFLNSKVQHCFREAQYVGPFHKVERRWWKGRLHEEAFRYIRKAKLKPVLAESFPLAFRRVARKTVLPSTCIYSGEKPADCVCYVLHQPVRRKYTLEYFPDERPAVMDVALVSYKAIREDNRVQDELFSSSGLRLLPGIRRN
jgi:CheY-like chemotaxis protein